MKRIEYSEGRRRQSWQAPGDEMAKGSLLVRQIASFNIRGGTRTGKLAEAKKCHQGRRTFWRKLKTSDSSVTTIIPFTYFSSVQN